MTDLLQYTDFKPWLNEIFRIQFTPEVRLDAKLIEVKLVNGYTPVERKPFSLIFRTSQKNEYYEQMSSVVSHPVMGEMIIFLVPIGFDEEGMRYQALFS